MTIRFGCTGCGRCCHGLRLPLGVAEAIAWLDRGGTVEILCDAAPAVAGDAGGDVEGYDAARSFAATSGSLHIRVRLMLVATFSGACPNLLPSQQCGAYDARPLACRIYPAEIRPDIPIRPADKLCPPEAWSSSEPVLIGDDGQVADPVMATDIGLSRIQSAADRDGKARLAAFLDIDIVALANEGYAIWSPDAARLMQALRLALDGGDAHRPGWSFVTKANAIRAMISDAGGIAVSADGVDRAMFLSLT